jgi:hypothetical protein
MYQFACPPRASTLRLETRGDTDRIARRWRENSLFGLAGRQLCPEDHDIEANWWDTYRCAQTKRLRLRQ